MIKMNEIIFFDWHHGDKNICGDTSFGQITLADWEGNKIDVVNIDCILESEFIKIFEILRLSENIKVEYNYL